MEDLPIQIKDIIIVFCLAFNNFIIGFNHAGPVFYNYTPDFRCKDHENENPCSLKNGASLIGVEIAASEKDSTSQYCKVYEYMGKHGEASIATEWNLVCDKHIYNALCTTVYFVAVGIGSLISGALADRCGRKKILYWSIFLQSTIGIVISLLAHTYITYIILRFIQGLLITGILSTTYLLMNELLPPKYHTIGTSAIEIFWGFGLVFLTVLAYFIPNWRHLVFATSLIALGVSSFTIWIVPESKIWLNARTTKKKTADLKVKNTRETTDLKLTREHLSPATSNEKNSGTKLDEKEINSETTKTLDSIETTKKVADDEHSIKETDQKQSNATPSQLKVLFATPVMFKRLLVMALAWFTEAISYFGVTYYIPELSGDHYVNFMISGAIEVAFFITIFFLINKIGRRTTMSSAFIVSGISYIVTAFLPTKVPWMNTLRTFVAIFGKGCLMGNFMCLLLYTVELFPPEVRGISLGVTLGLNQVGAFTSPIVLLLEVKDFWLNTPFLVFAAFTISSGLLCFFHLPDAQNEKPSNAVHRIVE